MNIEIHDVRNITKEIKKLEAVTFGAKKTFYTTSLVIVKNNGEKVKVTLYSKAIPGLYDLGYEDGTV